MSQFKIYSSSAGSGKTFTLTKEYLKLILQKNDPKSFRNILAITFTNDAANEMKYRILSALKGLSGDDAGAGKYAAMFEKISEELPDIEITELQNRAKAAFHAILHDYADFGVKTIDSFINQLVSSFTLDLELPYNYEIQLDKDMVLFEAAERLLSKVGFSEFADLSDTLTEFALSKVDDGKSWNNLVEDLVKFSNPLLNDQSFYLITKNDALTPKDYARIKKSIRNYKKDILDQIKAKGLDGVNLIYVNGLTAKDFTQGDKGIYGFYTKLYQNPEVLFEAKFPNKYHLDAIGEDKWYPKAASAGAKVAIDSIKNGLAKIAQDVLELKSGHLSKYLLLNEIEKVLFQLSLLRFIKEEFDLVLAEKNQVFLSEFNRKILKIVVSEPVPFIYERLGEKYDHILIDEFQDTSDLQFFNLLPLIENSLAKNNFNMIVGDPKQSIYRWRGGKVELMIHLIKSQTDKLKENDMISEIQHLQLDNLNTFISKEALVINYRSRKEIISFNNAIFEVIKEEKKADYPFIEDVFEDYKQEFRPDAPSGGHVEIEFLPYDPAEDRALDRILTIIEKAVSEGYGLGDIAVLSRTNRQSAEVAKFLDGKGYKIVSKDSLLLRNCLSVNLLIAFLELINEPGNELHRYEAVFLFFLLKFGTTPTTGQYQEMQTYIHEKETDQFLKLFERFGVVFKSADFDFLNPYTLTESLIEALSLSENKKDIPYLFTFLDLILTFYQQQSSQLQDFINHWKDIRDKSSIQTQSGEDAVTVTTIHKSKGLEYPVVIMPYAAWEYKPKAGTSVWVDLSDNSYEELAVDGKRLMAAPFILKDILKETEVSGIYKTELEMTFIESLNMLYVGLTRPTDKLYILSDLSHHNNFKGVGEFLMSYLMKTGVFEEGKYQYTISEGSFVPQKTETPQLSGGFLISNLRTSTQFKKLKIKSNASQLFDIETFEKQKDRGNKIHAGFALIKSKSDIDDAIRRLVIDGMIIETEKEEIRAYLKEVISHPKISFLFEEGLEIENEREILLRDHEIQRPDRVVFIGDSIFIVDYKTGDKKETHKKQLRNYGNLFAKMGYRNLNLLLIYLDPLHIEDVSL